MAKLTFAEIFMRREYPLDKYSVTIGRIPQCDITIPDYELFKKLTPILQREVAGRLVKVSRIHARISLRDGGYFIADVGTSGSGSSFGTFVNNTRLEYGKTHPIVSGDRVRFGPVECVFVDEPPAGNASAVG